MNTKKLIALALSALLAVSSLYGCGGGKEKKNDVKEDQKVETSADKKDDKKEDKKEEENTEESAGMTEEGTEGEAEEVEAETEKEADKEDEEVEAESEGETEDESEDVETETEKEADKEDEEVEVEAEEETEENENSDAEAVAENDTEKEEDTDEAAAEATGDNADASDKNTGSVVIDNVLTLPNLTIGGLSTEDIKLYFGIDITGIDLNNLDDLPLDQKMALYSFMDKIKSNFSEEDFEKLKKMSPEEILEFIKSRVEFIYSLQQLIDEAGINVKMDALTGEIVMDSAILFDFDKSEVSAEGKELITELVTIYSYVLLNPKFAGFIDSVIIEGHTDTNSSYEYNLKLSQARADSVRDYCLSPETGIDESTREALRNLLKAVGCSYDKPVYNADGTVNAEASRRVSFRFLINVE